MWVNSLTTCILMTVCERSPQASNTQQRIQYAWYSFLREGDKPPWCWWWRLCSIATFMLCYKKKKSMYPNTIARQRTWSNYPPRPRGNPYRNCLSLQLWQCSQPCSLFDQCPPTRSYFHAVKISPLCIGRADKNKSKSITQLLMLRERIHL